MRFNIKTFARSCQLAVVCATFVPHGAKHDSSVQAGNSPSADTLPNQGLLLARDGEVLDAFKCPSHTFSPADVNAAYQEGKMYASKTFGTTVYRGFPKPFFNHEKIFDWNPRRPPFLEYPLILGGRLWSTYPLIPPEGERKQGPDFWRVVFKTQDHEFMGVMEHGEARTYKGCTRIELKSNKGTSVSTDRPVDKGPSVSTDTPMDDDHNAATAADFDVGSHLRAPYHPPVRPPDVPDPWDD